MQLSPLFSRSKLKGAELVLFVQAMRGEILRAPEGAINSSTGVGIGGQFIDSDADYLILPKEDSQRNIIKPLSDLAFKQGLSVSEIELVSQGVEKDISQKLLIKLPPQKKSKEGIGDYLGRKFSDLQKTTNNFLESEDGEKLKENLGKFVKAAAPVATALAFAITPEILIPIVMGGNIAWGSVLTSGIIGIGVDYAINKGLDKLGVENQWVKMGAAVVGGLMVGGGLMALKDKLGNKITKIKTPIPKKEELIVTENLADDFLKGIKTMAKDIKQIIKDEFSREQNILDMLKLSKKNEGTFSDVLILEEATGKNLAFLR